MVLEKVGKAIALVSPVLAVGIVVFMLFGFSYGYAYGDSSGNRETGTITAFQSALEGDYAWFFWSGFLVAVCLVAAIRGLKGRAGIVLICATLLLVLSAMSMMTIGLVVLPLAVVLYASAATLTAARA